MVVCALTGPGTRRGSHWPVPSSEGSHWPVPSSEGVDIIHEAAAGEDTGGGSGGKVTSATVVRAEEAQAAEVKATSARMVSWKDEVEDEKRFDDKKTDSVFVSAQVSVSAALSTATLAARSRRDAASSLGGSDTLADASEMII